MKKMTKLGLTAILVLALSSSIAFAGGMHLSGIGVRALGMGGAFRAVASDYSAIYWNPAGLSQIQGTNLDFQVGAIIPSLKFKIDPGYPAAGMAKPGEISNVSKSYPVGNVGLTWDCLLLKGWKAGISVYAIGGMGATWDIFQEKPIVGFADPLLGDPNGHNFPLTIKGELPKDEMESLIGVVSVHPALAKQVNDQLSIGFGVNLNYGFITLNRATSATVSGADVLAFQEMSGNGIGFGFNAGFLYKVNDLLRVGASGRWETDISMDGDLDMTANFPYSAALAAQIPQLAGGSLKSTKSISFDLPRPLDAGIGIALTPNDQLTLSFDIQYTQWSVVKTISVGAADEEKLTFDWNNTLRFSVGAQYCVSDNFALRAGFYSDPSPAPDATLNPLLPDTNTKNSINFGFGYKFGHFVLNAVGEYLMTGERTIAVTPDIHGLPGVYNSTIPSFDIGLGYLF